MEKLGLSEKPSVETFSDKAPIADFKLTKAQISLHKKRLSVGSYEEYYDITLKPEVIKQYQINVDDIEGDWLENWDWEDDLTDYIDTFYHHCEVYEHES